MKRNPCLNCERAGCGSYHDECEEYQDYIAYRRHISEQRQALNNERYNAYEQTQHRLRSHKRKGG